MKVSNLLFSASMVKAIIREIEQPGTGKTQTRRAIEPERGGDVREGDILVSWPADAFVRKCDRFRPKVHVGDLIYVRERHHRTNDSTKSHLVGFDFADGPVPREGKHYVEGVGDVQFFRHSLGGWGGRTSRSFPGIHMPRWASRLTLEVSDVRIERLQEISEADAKAEGAEPIPCGGCGERRPDGRCIGCLNPFYANGFQALWDSINGDRPGLAWKYNPWVVAISFRPHLINIDAYLERSGS